VKCSSNTLIKRLFPSFDWLKAFLSCTTAIIVIMSLRTHQPSSDDRHHHHHHHHHAAQGCLCTPALGVDKCLIMAALRSRCEHYILPCDFYLSSSFFLA